MPWRHQFCDDRFRGFHAGPVEAVERARRQRAVELGSVGGQLGLQAVEHALGQAARVGVGLHHQRRHRADQHRLRHSALAVPGEVVHDLAATGGVADVDGVLEIEMRGQRGQVVGVVVHVVTVAGLGGASVAAPVMGDDAVAVLQEEQHLGVPVVGRQRPAVAEHDRLARAPVLVEDLRAVGGRDERHSCLLTWRWRVERSLSQGSGNVHDPQRSPRFCAPRERGDGRDGRTRGRRPARQRMSRSSMTSLLAEDGQEGPPAGAQEHERPGAELGGLEQVPRPARPRRGSRRRPPSPPTRPSGRAP